MENQNIESLLKKITELETEIKASKKYGLVWDKESNKENVVEMCLQNIPTLESIKKDQIKNGLINNLLIEGDNYHSLICLNYIIKGLVDVIYIDPPYNTGHEDFYYNDKMVNEEDGYRHSKWLSFMERRLQLARELLKDNGCIFISIDEHEFAQLKLLCDKIFGERNFVANITWDKRNPKGNSKGISSVIEYILVYCKNSFLLDGLMIKKENAPIMISKARELKKSNKSLNEINKEFKNWLNQQNFLEGEKAYKYIDENGRIFRPVSMAAPKMSKNFYDLIHPTTKKPCKVCSTGWRFKKETMDALLNEGRILFGADETTIPNTKYFLDENMSVSLSDMISYAGNGIDDLLKVDSKLFFDNPKPVYIIKKIIEPFGKQCLVLDFFAGSGTTGQSVLELNKEDGGIRKFILCTNNENKICETITYPRLKTIITGMKQDGTKYSDGIDTNLYYFRTSFLNNCLNTEQAKYNLVEKVDSLLCIKEDIFNEIERNNYSSHFSSNDKHLFIYNDFYNEVNFAEFKERVLKAKGIKIVYIYSIDNNIDESLFEDKDVFIKPIPSKIYEIYREIVEEIKRGE